MMAVGRHAQQRATGTRVAMHSPPRPLDEIKAALQRMEMNLSRAGMRSGSPGGSLSGSMNASAASHTTPSKQAIHGATDANGNLLMPRSAFLRELVSPPPAPPESRPHYQQPTTESNSMARSMPLPDTGSHPPTTKSTMLRRLEEDLKECTFRPNAGRRAMAKSAPAPELHSESPSHAREAKDTRAHSEHFAASSSAIFDRLYHQTTRHLSRTLAQKLGVESVELQQPLRRKSDAKRQLQRCPYSHPSAPIMDKDLAAMGTAGHTQPKKVRPAATAAPAAPAAPAAAADGGTPKPPPPSNKGIFDRLHREAAAAEQKRRAAEKAGTRRQVVSQKHALDIVERLATLERKRNEELEATRQRRLQEEQKYLEAKRREMAEHIRRPPGKVVPQPRTKAAQRRDKTAGTSAATRPATTAAAASTPVPGSLGNNNNSSSNNNTSTSPILPMAPVHHKKTSTGGESGMVLTPNGTWRRETPTNESAGMSPNYNASISSSEKQEVRKPHSPGVTTSSKRPPVNPLPLGRLLRRT